MKNRNIFRISDLTVEDVEEIFQTAAMFKKEIRAGKRKFDNLKGRTVLNIFFENSTRTRTSFELAGKRLGADVINISVATSSVKKGESLMDTAKTLDAMHVDSYIIRHSAAGAPQLFAKYVNGNVINAGDGTCEHPTQALLDAFTIKEQKGNLEGLNVAIVGDILHSRVARSNIHLLKMLGSKVTLVGPNTLVPSEFKSFGVEVTNDIDSIIEKVDVLNMLRIQMERQNDSFFPTLKEYSELYGLNSKRVARTKKDVVIMHPGPMNRVVEIGFDVADCERQFILEQVENGVAIRMALLYLTLK